MCGIAKPLRVLCERILPPLATAADAKHHPLLD
jgi:hypothetical protein